MGKLYTHAHKRQFAKGKPECAEEYLIALKEHPGLLFIVLEPLFEEGVIVDFNVLTASHAFETLEGGKSLANKKVGTEIPSSTQWFESCCLAFESKEVVDKAVSYPKGSELAWYKASFYRQQHWLLCNWSNIPMQEAPVTSCHVNAQEEIKGSQQVITPERMSSPADTIRTIIHEIRNPLTAIGLANQLLTELNNDPAHPELSLKTLTSIIFQNSRKIEEYLRQLLTSNPGDETKIETIDLCNVLENALQQAENRLLLSRVKVTRNMKPGHLINGNASKLSIAFLNIIINAVEAITHEGGHVWVSLFPVNDMIKVIIRDNGIGMDAALRQRIFEPYFTNKKNGLGVGLANVRQVLDMHGATIMVESTPGQGSSFAILFPALPAATKSEIHPVQYKMDF